MTISKLFGHSDIKTAIIYTKVQIGMLKKGRASTIPHSGLIKKVTATRHYSSIRVLAERQPNRPFSKHGRSSLIPSAP